MFSTRKARFRPRTALTALLGLALIAFAGSGTASADDRDLLRTSTGNPYVFIVLDTSGSMNWTPPCTQAQFNAGDCTTLCPYHDCFTRLQADDPNSKTYQAKEALYDVLLGVDDVQFGFATYNQDLLAVRAKHWIYRAGGGITLPGGTVSGKVYAPLQYPATNAEDVFGFLWSCDSSFGTGTSSNGNKVGCSSSLPADLSDPWSLTRMQRLPKGGTLFNQDVTYYVLWAGVTYKVKYHPTGVVTPAGTPTATVIPSTVQVNIQIDKCNNGSCSNTSPVNNANITYTLSTNATNGLPEEFLAWEEGLTTDTNRTMTAANPTITYFNYGVSLDGTIKIVTPPTPEPSCAGWDSNTDTASDQNASGYDLRWPTDSSDSRGAPFTLGDVIPLDWKTDHRRDIMNRLAPNLALDPTLDPDFRVATYFNNIPSPATDTFLRLKTAAARPFVVNGGTPLGATLTSFHNWFLTWKPIAAAQDPSWGCRRKYLLVITDGDESCNGDPCSVATTLKNTDSVLTYVVGLGLNTVAGNKLDCMAANGGTNKPFYPQNKQELINALSAIFSQIKEQASSFASAAVPTVQTDVADKIYISNFTPLNGASIWDGHIDSYLKPLPLNAAGLPDRTVNCPAVNTTATPRSACHLWDASARLIAQAPPESVLDAATTIDATALQLGLNGTTQRRVFYAKAASGNTVPRVLRLFSPPTGLPASDADWLDLFQGFNVPTAVASRPASAIRVTNIMEETLEVKPGLVDNGTSTPTAISYVLGDTFHADPTIYDTPNHFFDYVNDLYGNGVACGDDLSTGKPNNPGYRCWANKHIPRRKMLVVASDDSQLHFFDAGIYQSTANPPVFSDGDGWELFSFIPRLTLPIVRDLAEAAIHIYGVDSTPRIADVFIDPSHNGTPLATDRQWRSVLIGGFRDGGKPMGGSRITDFVSGYYALDITQPDQLDASGNPTTALVPSCLTLANTASSPPTGCGPVAFPALLWEFTDSLLGSRLDEDGNGYPDLGQTWSIPTVGRIQVKNTSGVVEDHFVAIFGGGMDGDNKTSPKMGNYLYIVDVETGQTLYKRRLTASGVADGSTPADPAVISSNNNGILDTIYIGTTAGYMYKIDMRTPAQLQNVTINKNRFLPNLAADQIVQRVDPTAWNPVAIFSTGGRPIYFPPTVVFLSKLDRNGLIFGTGDRDDLWSAGASAVEGRLYVIVDDNFSSSTSGLPFTESQYNQVTPTGPVAGFDPVLNPAANKQRGWYLRLPSTFINGAWVDERVITPAFSIGGLLVFSTYVPQVTFTTGPSGPVCGRTGESNAFTIYANNGDPVLSTGDRFQLVPVFLAPPTVDQGGTKNAANGQRANDVLTAQQSDIMQHLKSFMPKGTKFGNFWWNVSALGSDTRYVGIAAIPIGIMERNWKEIH